MKQLDDTIQRLAQIDDALTRSQELGRAFHALLGHLESAHAPCGDCVRIIREHFPEAENRTSAKQEAK